MTFDPKLSFAEHIRAVSIRGKQRLGLLRRAAPYISREGRLTVYKGFVQPLPPVLEYAPLVRMGAAPSHLARPDSIQRRALRIISPGTELQSLSLRRYVAVLTYTYKLHLLTGPIPTRPTQLLAVLPPRLEPRDATRTRNDIRTATGHSYQLKKSPTASSTRHHFPQFPALCNPAVEFPAASLSRLRPKSQKSSNV